jgi:hypothetical protein
MLVTVKGPIRKVGCKMAINFPQTVMTRSAYGFLKKAGAELKRGELLIGLN